MNYYNEFDPFAADWLRELVKAGLIPAGDVDDRSIKDVVGRDLRGYTQCHFFAGIGGWPLALQLAGWPASRPVWTGSCPCQPFSAAGKGAGFSDDRHLWPDFQRLIAECEPAVVFGEQVASKATDPWFDLVQTGLEALGYAFGIIPFPATSVGAPHIRDRAYWVADANGRQFTGQSKLRRIERNGSDAGRAQECGQPESCGDVRGLADTLPAGRPEGRTEPGYRSVAGGGEHGGVANPNGQQRQQRLQPIPREFPERAGGYCQLDGMGDPHNEGSQECGRPGDVHIRQPNRQDAGRQYIDTSVDGGEPRSASPLHSFWSDADWLLCRDGKWRPVEPGLKPLVNGVPNRVGKLRGYGNAIVPQQAAEFIGAFMECVAYKC